LINLCRKEFDNILLEGVSATRLYRLIRKEPAKKDSAFIRV